MEFLFGIWFVLQGRKTFLSTVRSLHWIVALWSSKTTYKTVRMESFVQKKIATFCSLVSICDKKTYAPHNNLSNIKWVVCYGNVYKWFSTQKWDDKDSAASATTTSDDDEFEVITSRLHARKMEHQQQQNIVKMCLTQKAQNHQCCQLYLFLILPLAISIKTFLRFDFQS